MPGDDDPIERARLEREARERAEAARQHPGREPSEWPPPPVVDRRSGAGNGSVPPPSIERTQKAFLGVWDILAVLFGAASAGWVTHAFFAKPIIAQTVKDEIKPSAEKLEQLQKSQEQNQRANEASFAAIKTDIEWLKRKDVTVETQPLTQDKKRK